METLHDDDASKIQAAPAEKPLLNRLLPWVVLLLAALALLYFLGRGCAGAEYKTSGTTEIKEKSVSDLPLSSSPAESENQAKKKELKPAVLPGGSTLNIAEGSCLAKLKEAMDGGDVNPNTAFILDNGDFQGMTAMLTPQSERELEQLASLLKAYPNAKIRIEAHTDNLGSADINFQLSTQQGLAIRSFLENRGITQVRIATAGRGQTKPLVPNDTEAGKAQNRRIEIYVVGEN